MVLAEYECRSEVSYAWKGEKADAETEVFFRAASVRGETENNGKEALEKKLSEEKAAALSECARLHEGVAECIATKFSNLQSTMQGMTFSGRKGLEESIRNDCTALKGKCISAKASDVKCIDKTPPTPVPAEGEGKKEEKKKK